MFENANESGLLDHWAKVKDIPYRQFGVRTDKAKFPVMRKDDDIYKVFMYLNLLPTAKCSFDKASHNLLIYSEVNKYQYVSFLFSHFSFIFQGSKRGRSPDAKQDIE